MIANILEAAEAARRIENLKAAVYAAKRARGAEIKGDVAGHEFHGNRYTGGLGDSRAFISEHFGAWHDDMSAAQQRALAFYQSPGYQLMNGLLRGEKPDAPAKDLSRARAAITNLTAAIADAPPLPDDVVAFRGMSKAQFDFSDGAVNHEPGFTSVALDRNAASLSGSGEQVMVEIRIPAGARVGAGYSRELILPANSALRVVSGGSHPILEYVAASVKGDTEGHPFHGNRYTGGIGGSAAEMTVAQWKDATEFANASMTEDERKDAFFLYDAEENNAVGRKRGTDFGTPREAQDYATQLVAKYAPAGIQVHLDWSEIDGLAAGNTELEAEPDHYHIEISPAFSYQQVVCHEVAHAIATEETGMLGHGSSFREAYLKVLDGEMPDYAKAVREALGKTPAPTTKGAGALGFIAAIVSPTGKSIGCFGPQSDQKGDTSGHAFHGNRYTGGIGGGEHEHARIVQPPEELARLGTATLLAKRAEAEKAGGLTHEWGGTNEQAFTSNLKRNITMMYSHYGGLTPARIDSFTKTWARSSTDSVADSIALQQAIADKFNLRMGSYLQERADYMRGGYRTDLLTTGQIEDIGRKVKVFVDEANQRLTGERSEVGQILPPYEGGVEGTQASHDFFEAIRQQDAMLEPLNLHNAAIEQSIENGDDYSKFDQSEQVNQNLGKEVDPDLVTPYKVAFAAYQESGISYTVDARNLFRGEGADEAMGFDQRVADAKQYVDAVYAQTQEQLRGWGVKYLALDRGMSLPDSPPGTFTKIEFEANPLSSWSADARIALRFAYHDVTSSEDSPNPWWFKAIVPAEKVFSLPFTGPGCYNENEVVCVKGDYDVMATQGPAPA